ncbi:mammalian cell entry protein [Mycolicibacterium tusciae]|jgi:Mce-associated membrane protein|uniref:Mammalian cell entry protein n=1 Tax=Mycolicibacterium tusciae TaxID=75922 RepID=A0A1X0JKQ9_9MYCO|nr:mammalian cell entry protein [Mycolicibacterium tusciae]ORB63424.1 mammalian cell entry protein [Mycolicibacterium tusciae]
MTSTPTPPGKPVRRRASRPAGPTAGKAPEVTAVSVPTAEAVSATTARKVVKPVVPPSRRSAPSRLVTIVALACGLVATAIVGAAVAVLIVQENNAEEVQARDQRFVDTATQVVVNMFSFKPDSIDDSVDQFYNSTSGPLRDMFSQNNNVENLKAIFRQTGGSSETVINGAALESFDDVSNNATVLVSARVTASDMNGNNRPSQPYRLRIIVHEDDDGRMTAYDLNYPNGGN